MSEATAAPSPAVSERHYQVVAGLALSGVVMIRMQQSSLLPEVSLIVSLLIGVIGVLGIVYRARLSPMLVLIAMAAPQVIEQYYLNQRGGDPHGARFFDLGDVMVCAAALTFFIAIYRLHGLWFGVLPTDPRVKSSATPAPPSVRSEASLGPAELIALVFVVPTLVVAAQVAVGLLRRQWALVPVEDPRWHQLFAVVWTVLIVMFAVAHGFRHWRRTQMDRFSAMLTLQDELWNETRGEQRTINRWIVWKKLTDRE